MSVRAKFKVTQVFEPHESAEIRDVYLSAVYDPDPGSENHEFWKYTPAGQIVLSTINPAAWRQFEVDKDYYVDFTPADPAK